MAELKVIIPDELEPELNWSEFIAKTIELKSFELELNRSNKLKLSFKTLSKADSNYLKLLQFTLLSKQNNEQLSTESSIF